MKMKLPTYHHTKKSFKSLKKYAYLQMSSDAVKKL